MEQRNILFDECHVDVTDAARPYLTIQRGKLWFLRDHPKLWDAAYNENLYNAYKTIREFLPNECNEILDVGSGMGGINILTNRHYGGAVNVSLLDGINDPPVVQKHKITFSNSAAAKEFLNKNGVREVEAIDPLQAQHSKSQIKYDLIYSFGAWCFHFEPDIYLRHVVSACKPGTVLILDVRNNKTEWIENLQVWFGKGEVIRTSEKFTKWRFIYGTE